MQSVNTKLKKLIKKNKFLKSPMFVRNVLFHAMVVEKNETLESNWLVSSTQNVWMQIKRSLNNQTALKWHVSEVIYKKNVVKILINN